MHAKHPRHAYYEAALYAIVAKRLPVGCSDLMFLTVTRRFVFDVNPLTGTDRVRGRLRSPLHCAHSDSL